MNAMLEGLVGLPGTYGKEYVYSGNYLRMKNDSSRRMNIYNIREVGWSMADQRVDLVQCVIRVHERR